MKTKATQILTTLQKSKKILLVAHTRPDGDAVGSILALGLVLEGMGLEVEMAVDGVLPVVAAALPSGYKIHDSFWPEGIDTAVILDCGGWKRTGFFETDELNINWPENVIVIDHHEIQNTTPGIHLIEPELSSTAELLFLLFKEWDVSISSEIATCLLAGMAYDTSFFKHSNTSKQTMEIGARLMDAGADLSKIVESSPGVLSAQGLRLWGRVLSRMQYHPQWGLVLSLVSLKDLAETGATNNDIDGLVGLMNSVSGIKIAMLVTEIAPGKYKTSVRTESEEIDVANIAALFGGGGHKKAAGFTLSV